MAIAIKHFAPDWVKPSFVIFDIQALWRSRMSVRVPGCQTVQITVWHCTRCFRAVPIWQQWASKG